MFDFDLGHYWNIGQNFLWSLILSVIEMAKDICIWVFDALMDVVVLAVDAIGALSDVFDITQYTNSLPSDVLNIMGLIGLGTCTQMIATAIAIRLLLQLIPFVRLGS
jgi:hypothetical protein